MPPVGKSIDGTPVLRDLVNHHESWLRYLLTISVAGLGATIGLLSKSDDLNVTVWALQLAAIFWLVQLIACVVSHASLTTHYMVIASVDVAQKHFDALRELRHDAYTVHQETEKDLSKYIESLDAALVDLVPVNSAALEKMAESGVTLVKTKIWLFVPLLAALVFMAVSTVFA